MADQPLRPPPMLPTEPPFLVPGRRRIHAASLLGLAEVLAAMGVSTTTGTALAPSGSLTLAPAHSLIALRTYTVAPTATLSIPASSILRVSP